MARKSQDGLAEPDDEVALDRLRSIKEEHQLSPWDVVRNYPALVWWAFFFAVSAVGW